MIHLIIVSHGHDEIIKTNLRAFIDNPLHAYSLIVRDNINSVVLQNFCQSNNIRYLSSEKQSGFAENNNKVVDLLYSEGLPPEEYLIFLNPDVLITPDELAKINETIGADQPDLFTIDLFRDEARSMRDPSVRNFPGVLDFASSYLLRKNPTIIERDTITKPTIVQWCAGSFLGVKASVFRKLGGFDERYFMYCEDLDFCLRAHQAKYSLIYYPQFSAVHEAQCSSQKFMSRHFRWHILSVIRFSFINPLSRLFSIKF